MNSKCPRPTTLLYASWVFIVEKGRNGMDFDNWEIIILKDYMCVCVCANM